MVENAGYTNEFDFIDATINTDPNALVDISDLYMYRMVIALDTDWFNMLSEAQQEEYARYLRVGGKLWVIGRRSFNTTNATGRQDYGDDMDALAYNYMNLNAAYLPAAGEPTLVEFLGATPTGDFNTEFPSVTLDSIKVAYTSAGPITYSQELFGVGHLLTRGGTETIYTFVSNDPYGSVYHGKPVAVRYDDGIFQTSYYDFPLYFLDASDAASIATSMLNWFDPRTP
jgi:hypothetical protein